MVTFASAKSLNANAKPVMKNKRATKKRSKYTKKMVKNMKNKKRTKKRGGGKGILKKCKQEPTDPYNREEQGLCKEPTDPYNREEQGFKPVKNVSFRNQLENNRNNENLNRAKKGLLPVELPNVHPGLKKLPPEGKRMYRPDSVTYK